MKVHKIHVDDLNIETKLFEVDGQIRVRVRDLDAGENVSLVICKDFNQGLEKFDEATKVN